MYAFTHTASHKWVCGGKQAQHGLKIDARVVPSLITCVHRTFMQRLSEVCLESRAPRGLAESQVLPSYNTSRDMNNRRAA